MRPALALPLVLVACSTAPDGPPSPGTHADAGTLLDAAATSQVDGATLHDGRADSALSDQSSGDDTTQGDAASGIDVVSAPDVPIGIDTAPFPDASPSFDSMLPTDLPTVSDVTTAMDVSAVSDAAPADGSAGEVVTVYAHTDTELYGVNPSTLAVTFINSFGFPVDGYLHQMTDLGVTATGQLWGVTFDALYTVNPTTAGCTLVAGLGDGSVSFNALTFVPAGVLGASEALVAATISGVYYQVNTTTGAITELGTYGTGIGSSGDIVSVAGAGTYATVTQGSVEYLASLDPHSGAATLIGPTGVSGTWGLGYWRALLYGFTSEGEFVTIDIATGAATEVVTDPTISWWGAGVTTAAPINRN